MTRIFRGRPVKLPIKGKPQHAPLPPEILAAAEAAAPRPLGPGDHLAAIIRTLRLEEKPGCGCAALRAKMNRLGPSGCREKIAELAAELEAKSALYGWGQQAAAGARALWAGLVNWSDPWCGLVEEACRRTEGH